MNRKEFVVICSKPIPWMGSLALKSNTNVPIMITLFVFNAGPFMKFNGLKLNESRKKPVKRSGSAPFFIAMKFLGVVASVATRNFLVKKKPPSQETPPPLPFLSSKGWSIVGGGILVLIIGFLVLSLTDARGQNFASLLSPILITLGYFLIGWGLIT